MVLSDLNPGGRCPGIGGIDDSFLYVRHGTTSLFAALDIATGKVIGQCHRQHHLLHTTTDGLNLARSRTGIDFYM